MLHYWNLLVCLKEDERNKLMFCLGLLIKIREENLIIVSVSFFDNTSFI